MRWLFLFSLFVTSMVTLARSQPSLSAELLTDRDVYFAGATNQISVYAHISAPNPGPGTPATIHNIVFVLDRSGSMEGPRIEWLRKAVSQAVHSLGEQDIVSVVFFGSEIETLIEAKRVDQMSSLDAQLAAVEPSGGSALYDALNQGSALLRRNLSPTSINHLILVTDGPATKGPREPADFTRLAETFARERITLSTIGIGEDFDEDVLANMARTGHGEYYFADKPEKLVEQIPTEVRALQHMVGRDLTVKIEFSAFCDKIESYCWTAGTVQDQVVTYTMPYICTDRPLQFLIQASEHARHYSSKIATLRLSWTDPVGNSVHEFVKSVSADFISDEPVVQRARTPIVARVIADAMARQGFEDAIEQLDKNDPGRALHALRNAREDIYGINFRLGDAAIDAKAHQLEAYLATLRNHSPDAIDRKILRSGIFHQFGVPTSEDASRP